MTDDGGDQFFLSPQARWAVFPVTHFAPLICHLLHTLTAVLKPKQSKHLSHSEHLLILALFLVQPFLLCYIEDVVL